MDVPRGCPDTRLMNVLAVALPAGLCAMLACLGEGLKGCLDAGLGENSMYAW